MEPITKFQNQYRFLSNFWPCLIELDNLTFSSVEHAYQAAKTTDEILRIKIAGCATAGQAKREGRNLPFLRPDWDEIKLPIMEDFIRQKFQINPLRKYLLQTDDAELIEGNWWGDTFWGVCNGKGQNHLGKILMAVREEIKNG